VDPFVALCRETWGEEILFDALKDLPHGPLPLVDDDGGPVHERDNDGDTVYGDDGEPVQAVDPFGKKRTRLMYAAQAGDVARLRWLIARGARLGLQDAEGRTAFSWACESGRVEAVRELLSPRAPMYDLGRQPSNAKGAVVALTTHAGVAAVCEWGCRALLNIAHASDAGQAACVAAGAPAAVVAALTTHMGVAAVCEQGCWALINITVSDAGQAACVAAGAPAAVVAALTTHAGVAAVCVSGCRALANIAVSDAGKAACVAAGAPAAVVAALTTHAGSSDVCLSASWALLNIACSDPAHRAAVVAARAVAPLAAALARHPSVREKAHAALKKLGYTDAGVKK
jgi:hypothetical protein